MSKIPKLLVFIFLLALFLRIFRLDTFPLGFHVDEAKVAWESLSILKTGRDDQGNLLALYYNSFGDYRPTGIFYITIPSLIIFGASNFAVRFPSALLGALTVFPIYYLTSQILKKHKNSQKISILASFLLAILPWHIATSRATSEVVISCFLILTSMAILIKKPKLSFSILAASFLFYHSARVMGPVLMLIWIIFLGKDILKKNLTKKIAIGFFTIFFLSLVLLLSKTGLARYNQVRLASPNLRNIIIEYTSYFDPNFLIGDIAKPFRYVTANVGIVSIPIFLCFIIGIFVITKTNKYKILLLFFILGPIPASLTLEDSPNLHRAFFMLPFLVIIAAIGFNFLLEKNKFFFKIFLFCIIWSFISFAVNYMSTENNLAYEYRDPQTKNLSLYLAKVKDNYFKIYITNDPDSPYPWYGFFDKIDPLKFNLGKKENINGKWEFENIVWDNTKCPAGAAFNEAKNNKSDQKILVIDNGACFTDFGPKAKIIKEFKYNEKVNYRVWEYAN